MIGNTAADRARIVQWVMFQMGGIGPMFGQLGYFFKFAGKDIDDPRPQTRYVNEAKRLLNVVDSALDGQDWIAGNFSIADIALAPWLNALDFYGAQDVTGFNDLRNVPGYIDRFYARPAVQKAKRIPDPGYSCPIWVRKNCRRRPPDRSGRDPAGTLSAQDTSGGLFDLCHHLPADCFNLRLGQCGICWLQTHGNGQ